jgi:NhaP-type Na+/H+ or K+/H+ antiporter
MNDLTQLGAYLAHYPSLTLVLTLSLIFCVGLCAQLLAEKTSLPGIIFLLIFGSALGKYGLLSPYGITLINPDVFSTDGVRAIIAIAVAIVVFEGALLIDLRQLRHNLVSVTSLITLNVLITIIGMAWITSTIVGVEWKIALLYASLVSVTGPTVIAPILKRLHIRHKIKNILETESVLVDAVGVIATMSIFNYITSSGSTPSGILSDIVVRLALGALSGVVCAGLARIVTTQFAPLRGELVRLLVLCCTILAYSLAELLAHESGIAAVVAAGLIIGNTNFPHKHSIKEFKGDLTLMSITVVFLLLAASLDPQILMRIGVPGALCVLFLMIVIRPLGVFLSTWTEKISLREKIFIASMGPRGIVAASAATFFAIELDAFQVEGSGIIRGMVFMTVLMTVIVEGAGARFMANWLQIAPSSVVIVGGGVVGQRLVQQLKDNSQQGIVLIENDPKRAEALSPLAKEGVYIIEADARSERIYTEKLHNLQNVHTLITTADDDWVNLRVCQIVKRLKPDVTLISIINDLKGREVFESLGIRTINLNEAAATVIYVLIGANQPQETLIHDSGT